MAKNTICLWYNNNAQTPQLSMRQTFPTAKWGQFTMLPAILRAAKPAM